MLTPPSSLSPQRGLENDPRDPRDPLDDLTIDLGAIFRFFMSNLRWMLLGALIGLGAGVAVSHFQAKMYEASARILYGAVRGGGSDQRPTIDTGIGDMPIDAQIELIRSDATVARVIDGLNLVDDPRTKTEFNRLSKLMEWAKSEFPAIAKLTDAAGQTPKPLDRAALMDAMLRRLDVKRVGRSPIVEITFKASDPNFAAQIANAFAKAYVDGQIAANTTLSAQTSEWLAARVADLRAKADAKDKEIRAYKASQNLELDGDGASLVEKRLADVDANLLKAKAALTALEGKQKQLEGLIAQGVVADVTDAVDDPGIVGLREKYLAAASRKALLGTRVGANNQLMDALNREIQSYNVALVERSRRVAEATGREIELKQARITALESQRSAIVDETRTLQVALAHLARLQAEANVFSKSFADTLTRYETALRDESFPLADARVIAQAEPPRLPVTPGLAKMGAFFAILGFALAFMACVVALFVRTARRAGARTAPAPR